MSAIRNWRQEKQSAHLYRVLAEVEPLPKLRTLFADLAREADAQANIWLEEARRAGQPAPAQYTPSARVRIVDWMVRKLGPRRMRPVLAACKIRGLSIYHEAVPGHPMPVSVDEIGRSHRGAGAGNLRAAVFGANDGLVSNASLILGMAGATASGDVVLLSGAAGLLAGAFSMAAGEWVSVRSQREMFESQIAAEREELATYPAEEAAELALIYEARGLPKPEARQLAERLVADPRHALDTLAREELGLDPAQLGSPWGAALFSFLSFAGGAIVPVLPFVLFSGTTALGAAIGLTATSLFGVGAAISLFTGRSALRGGLRMLLIGGSAGAATFLIGRLLGVEVAG